LLSITCLFPSRMCSQAMSTRETSTPMRLGPGPVHCALATGEHEEGDRGER
jgi:hypothetical protein